MHTQESGKGMKKLRNNKIRKLLAFMVALALMVSCMPSAYTISASEAFGDGTEDIFTDGEFTSEPAAEESTPDVSSADQEETEQAQQSTLTYENDSVKVTAEALEDGALPQNTALKADGVNENSSVSYDTVSQKLSAAATDKGSSLRGFFAYDVYFADGDGNRVEPNGRVRVTFEYKTPAAPELTDAASTSVTVEKLHYNSSTGDTDVNTLQANEDLKVLNVNEGKQIQTLQVETGNAAVFAVMWDSPETAEVEMERGAEASNCEMEFTLPNATISQVTKDPLGTLELQKVNSNKEGVDGARFTLYGDPDCENKIGDAVSTTVDGVKGKVIFNSKLRAGTYYLKETQAPDGYVGSTETWTVEAKKNPDNTAVLVTLKDSSGKSVENNQIVNQTRQEIIKSSMEYSKTAKVDSWDDRTYNINIKAASTSTSSVTTTTKAVADIMLVLDVSRSMNEQISSETVYTYFADNTAEGRKTLITGTTYYVEVDGSYEAMSYGWIRTDSGWKKD